MLTGVSNHLAGVPTIPEMVPAAHRATNEHLGTLSERVVTIASLLEASGYHTYLSGKWHLGSDPHQRPYSRGFEKTLALMESGADNWEHKTYIPIYEDATWTESGELVRRPSGVYSSSYLVDKMISFIDSELGDGAPFFAYLPFQAVHIPVQAPEEYTAPYEETYLGGALFQTPFNPTLPATTPAGLGDKEIALNRLAEAVVLLANADIALATPLGDLQRGHRMDEIIPLHGGNGYEGIANLQVTNARGNHPPTHPVFTGSTIFVGDSKTLSETGYNILHGSSFIMTLGFDEAGPTAEAILSYSQSGNPTSPHFTDQTYLYKDKQWRPILFSPEAIESNTLSKRVLRSTP